MKPNWRPLEERIGKHWAHFVYMGQSGSIHLYKNLPTQMYLYLDDAGRCYSLTDAEFWLADFDEEWGRIARQLGIEPKHEPSRRREILEGLAMHPSVRMGIRVLAAVVIAKSALELFSPWGRAFSLFEAWYAFALMFLPFYFLWELQWQREGKLSKSTGEILLILTALLFPLAASVLVILGLFAGNWIPVLQALFR